MAENDPVFADSNYFIALTNPFDSLHARALEISEIVDAGKISLTISNFIFLEVVTVLAQRRGKATAQETGAYLLSAPFIEHVHIDEWLHKETWEIFRHAASKNTSFVDCSIVAAMKAEGTNRLLTFDVRDFRALQQKYHFEFFKE